jgi:hypothetical protein
MIGYDVALIKIGCMLQIAFNKKRSSERAWTISNLNLEMYSVGQVVPATVPGMMMFSPEFHSLILRRIQSVLSTYSRFVFSIRFQTVW